MLVTQSCLTLCDPLGHRLPGSSVHGILQARILEWIAIPFSRGSSWPRDQTQVSCTVGRFFTVWASMTLQTSQHLTQRVPKWHLFSFHKISLYTSLYPCFGGQLLCVSVGERGGVIIDMIDWITCHMTELIFQSLLLLRVQSLSGSKPQSSSYTIWSLWPELLHSESSCQLKLCWSLL